ncbi:unnamed protein product [Lampetra fluviatilis]
MDGGERETRTTTRVSRRHRIPARCLADLPRVTPLIDSGQAEVKWARALEGSFAGWNCGAPANESFRPGAVRRAATRCPTALAHTRSSLGTAQCQRAVSRAAADRAALPRNERPSKLTTDKAENVTANNRERARSGGGGNARGGLLVRQAPPPACWWWRQPQQRAQFRRRGDTEGAVGAMSQRTRTVHIVGGGKVRRKNGARSGSRPRHAKHRTHYTDINPERGTELPRPSTAAPFLPPQPPPYCPPLPPLHGSGEHTYPAVNTLTSR